MQGEFSVIKNYGNDDAANLWAVTNPHKPKGADYYVYTVSVSFHSLLVFLRELIMKDHLKYLGGTRNS